MLSATKVKDKISGTVVDVGRNVRDKIDETRKPAAKQLRIAADAVSDFASEAADKVQATAEYVRERDVQGMLADLRKLIRKYPRRSILAAVAAGFLIGRSFRSNA